MTSSEYRNTVYWTLHAHTPADETDLLVTARRIFNNLGVPFPQGTLADAIRILSSGDYMGWSICNADLAQQCANNGYPAIAVNENTLSFILPEEHTIAVNSPVAAVDHPIIWESGSSSSAQYFVFARLLDNNDVTTENSDAVLMQNSNVMVAAATTTTCSSSCQVACQSCNTCQTSCELNCQTGCQVSCQTTCQASCQTGCQVSCQSCNTCQSTCELSCQTGCQVSCQSCNSCQSTGEICLLCNTICEVSGETQEPPCSNCQFCQTNGEVNVKPIYTVSLVQAKSSIEKFYVMRTNICHVRPIVINCPIIDTSYIGINGGHFQPQADDEKYTKVPVGGCVISWNKDGIDNEETNYGDRDSSTEIARGVIYIYQTTDGYKKQRAGFIRAKTVSEILQIHSDKNIVAMIGGGSLCLQETDAKYEEILNSENFYNATNFYWPMGFAARTGLGYKYDSDTNQTTAYLVVSEANARLSSLRKFFKEDLCCDEAIHLDGSGSSGMQYASENSLTYVSGSSDRRHIWNMIHLV